VGFGGDSLGLVGDFAQEDPAASDATHSSAAIQRERRREAEDMDDLGNRGSVAVGDRHRGRAARLVEAHADDTSRRPWHPSAEWNGAARPETRAALDAPAARMLQRSGFRRRDWAVRALGP
jgi:hypothetical protein